MKFSAFTVLVAGAALASANPLIIVGHAESGQALRPSPVLYAETTPHSAADRVSAGLESSFEDRLEAALMNLQPWEAGAVAFVLGCGIGVLLRMFFVLTILMLRSFRAPSSSATDYYYYVAVEGADHDAEEVLVAPPVYTVAAATEKA
uniref:Uncharacterized protein n=1 Tax=Mycena chlorophos TaxID=658473 RepID=A0ABQ0LPY0_MYCCL|nr:predicted protein [Mycena chlorophos]